MSKRFQYMDLDAIFEKTVNPVVINDLPAVTEEDKKAINEIVMTTYEHADVLSSVPSCACGHTRNGYNVGRVCTKCNNEVTRPVESDINLKVWLRAPTGVRAFILPVVWVQLTKLLSPTGYNMMDWLTSASGRITVRPTEDTNRRIAAFTARGWVRGLGYFIENFDKFLDLLVELKIPRSADYIAALRGKEDIIFPRHLPMPTKALLVLECTYVGNFSDLSITGAIDAARTITSLSTDDRTDYEYLERKTVSVIKNLAMYYVKTIKESFSSKKGWLRGQLFSSRSQFCLRGVITSISDVHHYEDLHIPWAQGLELFKYHITSRLLSDGYSSLDAYGLVESSGNVYNPIIDKVLKDIIAEAPGRGVPCLFLRNPTLERGSSQCLNITKVKTDITDRTISMSVLVLTAPNADFDGDEMSALPLLDNEFIKYGKLMRPHYGIHNLIKLRTFKNAVRIPDVTESIISNWINEPM